MPKTIIQTDNAPAAVGPYSQAVKMGDLVFVSGQIPLIPGSGEIIKGGIDAQARQALDNLMAVLTAAGCPAGSVVKTTVYLTDMVDFEAVNAIYAEYFPDNPPARACVEVSRLPKDVSVEVEAVACVSQD